jgi:DNA invertase Pin-like site-specific DNA recombinase
MRLDLVIRTSHRKRDAISPGQQRRIADDFARRTGHEIATVHDSGRSESGKTMDRAALREVRARVRGGATDGVLVAYLDRLGRAPIEESMTFVRELVGDGGALVAADWSDEPIDLADPNVEDMLVFRLQMNRSMWNKASERQRLNKRDALAAGKFIGITPFGYAKRKGALIPDPRWAPIVTETFRRAARDGWQAAVEYLRDVAPDERKWRTDMVRKLLASRTYLGEHAGRGLDGYKPHPALIDEPTWSLAQHSPRSRRANGEYLLSGLVRCSCGATLIGQRQAYTDRAYELRRYRCADGHTSCNADALDALVRAELRSVVERDEIRDRLLPAGVDKAREELERAQTDQRNYALAVAGLSDPSAWAEGAAMHEQRVSDARAEYRRLSSQAGAFELFPAAEELGDDVKLQRALGILAADGLTLRLSPGRSQLAERVGWFDDGDFVAGTLAA